MEKRAAVRFEASWDPEIEIRICRSRAGLEELMEKDKADVMGFADGSGYKGGIGAAAILYKGGEEVDAVRLSLGSEDDHEVYEAECAGLILTLHLARKQAVVGKLSIWIDNTAAITATNTATPGPSHYLLDHFHSVLTELRAKHPGIKIIISWVPGHMGYAGNERADSEAKKAAMGQTSYRSYLPSQLQQPLPRSRTSVVRVFAKELGYRHSEIWNKSPRYEKFQAINASNATMASRGYWKLLRELPRKLLTILTQLRMGHIPLQRHLHRIRRTETDVCPCCKQCPETVFHYIMQCSTHRVPRARLRSHFSHRDWNIATLLTKTKAIGHLFRFINDTNRFHHIIGELPDWEVKDDEG